MFLALFSDNDQTSQAKLRDYFLLLGRGARQLAVSLKSQLSLTKLLKELVKQITLSITEKEQRFEGMFLVLDWSRIS